jgi:hypothetical protein
MISRGKGVPARLWQQALEEQFVPRLPPSRDDLLVLLTRTTKRKVHHYGIEFEHLLYQSTALALSSIGFLREGRRQRHKNLL